MASWGDVLEDVGPDPEVGAGWSAVLDTQEERGPSGWDGVIEEIACDGAVGEWGDIFGDVDDAEVAAEGADGATEGAPDRLVPFDAAVGEVVDEGVGDVRAQRSPREVIGQVVSMLAAPSADDPLAPGRSLTQLSTLPLDTKYRGAPVFETEAWDIAMCLGKADKIQTLQVVREETGCTNHEKVGSTKRLLGSAVCQVTQYCLADMLDKLTSAVLAKGGKCIALTYTHRYDETPLKARALTDVACPSEVELGIGMASASVVETSATKIVQHEWAGVALFSVGGQYEAVRFSMPTWLSSADRTTAEVYRHQCLQAQPKMPRIMDRFSRCQRLATTDGDGAIAKAERSMANSDSRSMMMHLTCDVHRVSGIGRKIADLLSADVSGMIQLALSLSTSGAMRSFRRLLFAKCCWTVCRSSPGRQVSKQTIIGALCWTCVARLCPAMASGYAPTVGRRLGERRLGQDGLRSALLQRLLPKPGGCKEQGVRSVEQLVGPRNLPDIPPVSLDRSRPHDPVDRALVGGTSLAACCVHRVGPSVGGEGQWPRRAWASR